MLGLRTPLQSSQRAKRERLRKLYYSVGILSVLALLLWGTSYLLKRVEVTIQTIDVQGTTTISDDTVRGFVERRLEGNYLFLFPRSSIFLYPRGEIKEGIIDELKKIKEVDVGFGSLTSIYVRVVERSPQSLYCGVERREDDVIVAEAEEVEEVEEGEEVEEVEEVEEAEEAEEGEGTEVEVEVVEEKGVTLCYFLDEKGIVYTEAPHFTGNVYFRFFGALHEGDPVGQSFLPENKFRELTFFLASLRESDIHSVELVLRDDSDYELYLESGVRILFPRDLDFVVRLAIVYCKL